MVANPPVVPAALGDSSSAIGAAALVLNEVVIKQGLLPGADPC